MKMIDEMGLASTHPDVIIGTPICRRTSFVLDKFLSNQQEIQQAYLRCSLVLATDEPGFVAELWEQINLYHLKGEAITYETVKPDYARSRAWSIACGREALRQYTLSHRAEYFLSLDGDMTYEPSIISVMKGQIQGFDVVLSGYQLINPQRFPRGDWGFAGGCILINRELLNKITFRCYEFKNGEVFFEDELLYLDLFKYHARVNKGIFISIKHYANNREYYAIEPQPVGWLWTLPNTPLVRYIVTKMNIMARHRLDRKPRALLYKIRKSFESARRLAK